MHSDGEITHHLPVLAVPSGSKLDIWLDPAASLAIAVVILWGTWDLFKQSLHLLFDGVPNEVNLADVRTLLLGLPSVTEVHDLHVWAMGTSDIALTAHLVHGDPATGSGALLHQAEHELHAHFEIRHVTLQLESAAYALQCGLRSGSGCQ